MLGTISTGRRESETAPTTVMTMATTLAKTGRRMKKRANILVHLSRGCRWSSLAGVCVIRNALRYPFRFYFVAGTRALQTLYDDTIIGADARLNDDESILAGSGLYRMLLNCIGIIDHKHVSTA